MRVSITDPWMTLVHSSTDHLRSGRYIMSNRASCKQASSIAMMIVTTDGEADYGMPNTAPILRCHLRRRVLSLHYEEQHVII